MNDKQRESIKTMDANKLLNLYTSYVRRDFANGPTSEEDIEILEALGQEIFERLERSAS